MNGTIEQIQIYTASLHILDAFLVDVDKPHLNFRMVQAFALSQVQVLQIVAMGHEELFRKITNVYRRIDGQLPPSYSVLHESNINKPADSRRSPPKPMSDGAETQGQGGTISNEDEDFEKWCF